MCFFSKENKFSFYLYIEEVENHKVSIHQYIRTIKMLIILETMNLLNMGNIVDFYSIKSILNRLFICHNKLINVWAHQSGIFIFIVLMVYIFSFLKNNLNGLYKLIESFI